MNPVRVLKILTGFFHKVLSIPSVNFDSPEGEQIKQRWVTELGVKKPCPPNPPTGGEGGEMLNYDYNR